MSSNSPLKRSGQTTSLENNFIKALLKLKIVETNIVTAYDGIVIWVNGSGLRAGH